MNAVLTRTPTWRRRVERSGRRHGVYWLLTVALLSGVLAAALAGPAAGQQRLVISGFVQYISGSIMQIMADGGASVRVDLTLVAQSDYNTLRGGDRVQVFGYVSPDRNRLIGERVDRLDVPNVYAPYSPYPQSP